MRSIHIYARDYPPSGAKFEGGLYKAVHGLASGLAANGADVNVLCHAAMSSSLQSPAGFTIRSFAATRAQNLGLSLPPDRQSYIHARGESDFFLLNGVFTPAVYRVSRACLSRGVPYFFWPHDPYHPSLFARPKTSKTAYWYLRERRLLRNARAIQVFDATQADLLTRRGVKTPVIEMVNGFADEDVLDESALEWRTSGAPRLLFLGRMDSYNKGLDILLDAFAGLAASTDVRLTLQGPDGGDLAWLRNHADSLGLTSEQVMFMEPDFDRTAAEIIAGHDILVLPSRFEGFALVAIEAMVAGRVLLVSDVNAVGPHVCASGCGVVVSPDVESVKAGLEELLATRPKWNRMGECGREYALSHFSWSRIAADLKEQYESFLQA